MVTGLQSEGRPREPYSNLLIFQLETKVQKGETVKPKTVFMKYNMGNTTIFTFRK